MSALKPNFEQFIEAKTYLTSVTPATVQRYRFSLRWMPSEAPTQAELIAMVIRMREQGLKEISVNTVINTVNTYLHWAAGIDSKCGTGCTHLRLNRIREPQKVMPTYTDVQVKALVRWKPQTQCERRLHILLLVLFDTGARLTEALTLGVSQIDFDNLLVTLDGKGRKQRVVPISVELRKALYKFIQSAELRPHDLLLGCANQEQWERRNALRAVTTLCRRLGFKAPSRAIHAMRHTVATGFIRHGGSVLHLQQLLGHSTARMAQTYVHLTTDDLKAVHSRISLLR